MSVDLDRLTFLPRPKFLRQRPIMLITDMPLDLEVKGKSAYSSQSAANMFSELNRVGAMRTQVHATYLFNCRLEKGDVSAIFHKTGMPISEYTHWNGKESILNFALNELNTLRDEIAEVKPALIICAGRWALYFLTGETSVAETRKSPFGTLLKWRASHLKLTDWWNFSTDHVVIPVLPASSAWQLPEKATVIRQDYTRIGLLAKAAILGNITEYVSRDYKFIVQPKFAEVKEWFLTELVRLEQSTVPIFYALDTETRCGYHDCVGIAKSETEAICIPFATMGSPAYWSEAEEYEIISMLRTFMLHPKVRHIGQNYWYDMQYFWRDLLIDVKPEADTMVMQHTLFPGLEKSLDFLASLYCKVYKYWKDEGKASKGKTDLEHWIYNCKDCCYTFEAKNVLEKMLAGSPSNIQAAYNTQLNRSLPALVAMMRRGVLTRDYEKVRLYKELTALMAEIKLELNEIIGEEFNPKSSDHKKALFYDLFELPVQYDPKTKKPTLGADALDVLKEKFPIIKPIADRIAEYGNLATFSSTFLAAKLDIDGRMRCSYNLCGTDTFRLSSSKNAFDSGMNLQNVPKGGKTASGRELPNVRSLFIPDPGYTFFDIDLSSADARIVAWEADCKELQDLLLSGEDLYSYVAREYYHDPLLGKKDPRRQTFKGVIHGTHYLGSAAGLAVRFGLLVHEVDTIQRWYFGKYPEIKNTLDELKKQVMKRGWIENVLGYRRYFFNKSEPTIMQIAAAWKPQSTVGLIINCGMANLHEQEKDVQLLMQVHDSLAGQYPTHMPELEQRIIKHCEIELPYRRPLVIPVEIKTSTVSWGDC